MSTLPVNPLPPNPLLDQFLSEARDFGSDRQKADATGRGAQRPIIPTNCSAWCIR